MQVLPDFFFTHPHPISLDGYYVDYPRDELRIKVIVYSLYTVESVRTGVMLFDMYTRFGSGTVDVGKTNPYLLGVSAAVCPLLGASVLVLLVYLNIDTAIRDSFDDHASIVYVQNLPFIPQSMVGGYHHLGTCFPLFFRDWIFTLCSYRSCSLLREQRWPFSSSDHIIYPGSCSPSSWYVSRLDAYTYVM